LDIAESTYYDRKQREEHRQPDATLPASNGTGRPVPGYSLSMDGTKRVTDEQLAEWFMELAEGEEQAYGYKLLTQCIRDRHHVRIDKKKGYRICKELGLLQNAPKRVPSHPRRLPKNRIVTGRNQLWQMDIKYGYAVEQRRFFFVLTILDVLDRVAVQQYRGPVCEAKHVVQTLWQAVESRIQPGEAMPVIRTDNGPQFVSRLFGDTCESLGIVHERIPPRCPNMNASVESFHSILERELFSRRPFNTLEEAYRALDQYMDFYNNRRMHGSCKKMAPVVFSEWLNTQPDTTAFHKAM
jgi:putative transposase